MGEDAWVKVIFFSDCIFEDWDIDKEEPICPVCNIQYADCSCPGPTTEDEYEYKEIDGVLYAKSKIKV